MKNTVSWLLVSMFSTRGLIQAAQMHSIICQSCPTEQTAEVPVKDKK
jgi:hypothetical protein